MITSMSSCVQYVLKQMRACMCITGVLFVGCVQVLVSMTCKCVCLHACLFLACVSMCIIMCVFYGPCAVVCVGCRAHPCELLGVSGSRPSSLLCSPRSVLLASLSSLALLCCRMLCVQLSLTLFYSNLSNLI